MYFLNEFLLIENNFYYLLSALANWMLCSGIDHVLPAQPTIAVDTNSPCKYG